MRIGSNYSVVTTAPLSSHRAEMDIQWGAVTDVGKVRRLNEDSYLDVPGAFVVADGMGSTLVGAFVVQNADEESIVIVNVGDSRCDSLVDDLVSTGRRTSRYYAKGSRSLSQLSRIVQGAGPL